MQTLWQDLRYGARMLMKQLILFGKFGTRLATSCGAGAVRADSSIAVVIMPVRLATLLDALLKRFLGIELRGERFVSDILDILKNRMREMDVIRLSVCE